MTSKKARVKALAFFVVNFSVQGSRFWAEFWLTKKPVNQRFTGRLNFNVRKIHYGYFASRFF